MSGDDEASGSTTARRTTSSTTSFAAASTSSRSARCSGARLRRGDLRVLQHAEPARATSRRETTRAEQVRARCIARTRRRRSRLTNPPPPAHKPVTSRRGTGQSGSWRERNEAGEPLHLAVLEGFSVPDRSSERADRVRRNVRAASDKTIVARPRRRRREDGTARRPLRRDRRASAGRSGRASPGGVEDGSLRRR
jgi:hypothetical protein